NMSEPVKLLISGSVGGRLDDVYKRCLRAQKKSGAKFAMLFCVGDFFGAESGPGVEVIKRYISGATKAPLTTYVVSPLPEWANALVPDPSGCEIGPNLIYLGRRGLFSGQTGLKVAYLAGTSRGEESRRFRDSELAWLAGQASDAEFPGVDLLLTCAWPAGTLTGCEDWLPMDECQAVESASKPFAHPAIARLAARLRPRYHVVACGDGSDSGLDFERLPYRNHRVGSERERHSTRFHSLAGVSSGRRCLYALQLTPLAKIDRVELLKQTPSGAGVTDCPYKDDGKDVSTVEAGPRSFFFAEASGKPGHAGQKRRSEGGGGGGEAKRRQQQAACWFCLGNPEVQRQLVVSVAKSTYLALARGPLVPQHVIALPIGHHKCLSDCPAEVLSEFSRYKRCLAQLYAASELAPVYIERNFKCFHAQLHCIPVPVASLPGLKAAFLDVADKHEPRLSLRELHPGADLADLVPPGAPYFCADLPTGERLFCPIRRDQFDTFPLSFGRDVLASHHVYDCPTRVDWRDCLQSEAEETAAAEEFKKSFAPFDFSLNCDE
ncbi:hypothetical protein BOX15_Mlig029090g1, partial [Macrostomum lignano]